MSPTFAIAASRAVPAHHPSSQAEPFSVSTMLPSSESGTEAAVLARHLAGTPLAAWAAQALPALVAEATAPGVHGDLPRWEAALAALPQLEPSATDFDTGVCIGAPEDIPPGAGGEAALETALEAFVPWRKGPFSLFGVQLDAEWRCDLKWSRVLPHISPLRGRRVLDVGCGNGYYAMRMLAASPALVLGVDPHLLYWCQYRALRRYLPASLPLHVLPLALEALPEDSQAFDTVFSMGVLYHRRSPIDHLTALRRALVPGGELVLETLIVEGGPREVLMPEGRYANMRNVWFLPSVAALEIWLRRAGFLDVREVDRCATTPGEQRATRWMPFRSLADFLDPQDPALTREGHPAPLRTVLVARNRQRRARGGAPAVPLPPR
jgi:tRNA (mo5U34)-methyltransferase